MSAFVSPRRAGVLPPYLPDRGAQAARQHARRSALLWRQVTATRRQHHAPGLLAPPDAAAAPTRWATPAMQRWVSDARQGSTLTGTLIRNEGTAATADSTGSPQARAVQQAWRAVGMRV
ncbi:hypothetical protein [Xanthomonas cannabis]|uniref:Uncharacterized protein n=1 Tax=Xanthomonas cannabis TaxID=1885674 RepID=A0ABR6JQ07_9XANT|nr:hypothetical protein [Xanthomonas cannabis]MBB4594788.1 hypothetical protein [Xanthomonas cannabis]MBB5523279.1 hypothetical protein [Xanthomonas cannabis]